MQVFYLLFLCVLSFVGAAYLLRDAYRLWLCRRLLRAHFTLLAEADSFEHDREAERALLQLSTFLTRPEARYLVQKVVIVNAAPQIRRAAQDCFESVEFVCREDFTRP